MHFVKNIEDEKLELHFTREQYLALPNEQKQFIKRNFRFAYSNSLWRSKKKLENIYRDFYTTLKEYGFEDRGTVGEKLSFSEKVEREQQKAADRADYMIGKKIKSENESLSYYNRADKIASYIPFGQPILVGHHSEKRHRSDLKKIDNNMHKSVEASKKADYYQSRYESSVVTAEGEKYKNPAYLMRKIAECEKYIRKFQRYQQGKTYTYSKPAPITEQTFNHYQLKINEEQEKLEYFKFCIEKMKEKRTVWDKESLKGMNYVKIRGRWDKLLRCNPKTVISKCLITGFELPYNYGEIQDAAKELGIEAKTNTAENNSEKSSAA